jgi:hypothetical protein
MLNRLNNTLIYTFFILFSASANGDSFKYNSFNNHGSVGLINTPTARFFNEAVHGITIYDGTPDQKITLTSNPYDWLEASFFYTNVQGLPYPGYEYQDYKDKGFNVKIRLKEEGVFPALAIGMNDFAGTGLYSSEYIVASQGINNLDLHFGIGWDRLGGDNGRIKNPLIYIHDSFEERDSDRGRGGKLEPGKYFSGQTVTPFYGISYVIKDDLIFKIEKDPTDTEGSRLKFYERNSDYSISLDYSFNDYFDIGFSYERGNYFSIRFVYKNDPSTSIQKYEYKEPEATSGENQYTKLIKNLEENGIGVERIVESSRSIGLDLTQFVHSDIRLIEEIISEATMNAGIKKDVKKDLNIANLKAISELDEEFENTTKLIYQRDTRRRINTDTGLRFRPFLASREEFFKGALLIENNTEFIIRENLFFNTNLKYSLVNNFDNLRFPPVDTYPAQVRSDIKQYLLNMDKGILIGRAQFDYYITPKENHHFMATAGILEDMFSGVGLEYLYSKPNLNYAYGFEIFDVKKRDYEWGFGHLNYRNTLYTANLYYRNYGSIPFDMKISAGEYLAGDIGSTIEFSRTFKSGINFGVFATFTDVSFDQYGEGSFDKGIFFNIPIYGNFINYTWRPLTKDPGAKLVRRNSLHELLVKFKPIN